MTPAAVWSIVSIVLSLVLVIALIALGIRAWNYMGRSKHGLIGHFVLLVSGFLLVWRGLVLFKSV
ncbi:hypothetical protein, partial [Trueperella pyogenes]|uniref:hypothetical protein n=1 Tax=Trueperella pyogenes TaxID=1661 RepID=UPI00345D8895